MSASLSCRSGIWNCPGGQPNHVVKCIGYGNQGGTNYLLCVNSWSTNWGENGFFKVKFPGNGCMEALAAFDVDYTGKNRATGPPPNQPGPNPVPPTDPVEAPVMQVHKNGPSE